ncbi:MAG: SRPBCC family protein [Flavobacteriales bacterium]|nr:SRPBCC family protein [Flavobacteriales bacterium]
MEIKVQVKINKSIDEVWEVMGNQFGEAHLWSSNFKTSKPGGNKKFEGIDYSLRDTTTANGNTIQELREFEPKKFSLKYEITAGKPEIAKTVFSHWYLKETAEGTTAFMDSMMEPRQELSQEIASKIQMGLTASFQTLANELKFFLEEGKPHPNNHNK